MSQNGTKSDKPEVDSTNRRFRRAVGRVLIALSFRERQKSDRSYSNGCDDVTPKGDKNPSEKKMEPENNQTKWKNCSQVGTLLAIKDSSSVNSNPPAEEPNEEDLIIRSEDITYEDMSRSQFDSTTSKDLGISYPGDLLSEVPPQGQGPPVPVRRAVPPPLVKRNTIADFVSNRAFHAAVATLTTLTPGTEQEKKTKSTFSLLKLIDKKSCRSKENLSQLNDVLQNLEQSEFVDHGLALYKDGHWLKVVVGSEPDDELAMSNTERRRREAVWELFTSECVFLFDHLMVLKHCFLEPLKKVKAEGFLQSADPQKLFGNLDELCHVSYTFCYDFIQLLLKDTKMAEFGKTEVLLHGLRRFSELTRDGEVYHEYCLNYPDAMSHLEGLRKSDEFCEYEKWCEQDQRCHRLQLPDLLIAPMQHCTKVPLLLNHIRSYTEDPEDQLTLAQSLENLEDSLKNLNLKMTLMRNLERVHQIRRQLCWQPIMDLDPKANIPEFLRVILADQPTADILIDRQRHLIYEGPVMLNEISSKTTDAYLFLFDDILLITKMKKQPRKRITPPENSYTYWNSKFQSDGCGESFLVHKQPISLDCLTFHDVKQSDATASGLKNVFVILNQNRFQQVVGIYTIQTLTEAAKTVWLNRLQTEQQRYRQKLSNLKSAADSFEDCILEPIPPTYLSISAWNTYRERGGSSSVGASPNRLSPSSQFPDSSGPPSSSSTPRNTRAPHPSVGPGSGAGYTDLASMPRARANSDLSHSDGDVYFAKATELAMRRRNNCCLEAAVSSNNIQQRCVQSGAGGGPTDALVSGPDAARGRPSSWHSKRRIQLKAIREKSLSVDLPSASVIAMNRSH